MDYFIIFVTTPPACTFTGGCFAVFVSGPIVTWRCLSPKVTSTSVSTCWNSWPVPDVRV